MKSEPPIAIELRRWSEQDLPLLERLMGDPAMTEHLGGPETPDKIRKRHARYLKPGSSGNDHMYAILAGTRRVPAGSIGYWEKEWQGQLVWETGWSVLPEFQGQGIATGATLAIVKLARADGRRQWLHAFPSVDNGASNAVCRKAGFTLNRPVEFEYPPGSFMQCNDWCLDLSAEVPGMPSRRKGA